MLISLRLPLRQHFVPQCQALPAYCSTVEQLDYSVEQLDCPAAQWSFSVKKIQKNCTVKKFAQLLRLVSHIPKDITHVCLIHPTIACTYHLCDTAVWYTMEYSHVHPVISLKIAVHSWKTVISQPPNNRSKLHLTCYIPWYIAKNCDIPWYIT